MTIEKYEETTGIKWDTIIRRLKLIEGVHFVRFVPYAPTSSIVILPEKVEEEMMKSYTHVATYESHKRGTTTTPSSFGSQQTQEQQKKVDQIIRKSKNELMQRVKAQKV